MKLYALHRPPGQRSISPGLWVLLLLAGQILVAQLDPLPAQAQEWPKWQGSRGDGVSAETGIFPADTPPRLRELWRRPLGRGYSGVSVADGRAVTLMGQGEKELVIALDVRDGRELWSFDLGGAGEPYGPYSTPLIDTQRIFALSSTGRFEALDVATGKSLWSHDLVEEFDASAPGYGFSTSPLAVGDRVVLLAGGKKAHNLLAFDMASGDLAWTSFHAEAGSYATPALATLAGEPQIVVPAGQKLYGLSATGQGLLWSHEIPYPERSPLILPPGQIFLPFEQTAILLEVRGGGEASRVVETWRKKVFTNSFTEVIYHDGALYGFSSNDLLCVDAASGTILWQERLFGGSLILVDGHLVVLDSDLGTKLRLIVATREGFDQAFSVDAFVDRTPAFLLESSSDQGNSFVDGASGEGEGSLTAPSFAAGRVFLRNQKEVLTFEVLDARQNPSVE